jgi:ankyrin repeat protein
MAASQDGHVPVVKALLAHGADVNAVTDKGTTALAVAQQTGKTDVAALLEQAGATQ